MPDERYERFCAALIEALDRELGDWRDHADLSDLRAWVRRRWPLPIGASPVMGAWARCFYNEHEQPPRRPVVS